MRGVQRSRPVALKDPFARLVVLGPAAAAWVERDIRHARDILRW